MQCYHRVVMLITNATIITMTQPNRVIRNGALLIRDGLIADLGEAEAVRARNRYLGTDVIDAQGKIALPGNICAHTHFYGAFARGMAIPGEPPRNFIEVLQKLWWRLDRALDYEGVRYSALVCLVDAIKHGTTTLIDHHASPNAIEGVLDTLSAAVEESGLRAALCYEVTDRNGPEGARAGIEENRRFARACASWRHSRVKAACGVHASFTVSDETLEQCIAVAKEEGIPLHIHVAEDEADQRDCERRFGMRVVERLQARGALGPRTICAHAIHVNAREITLLSEYNAKVTHQPRSNMNNGVGVADVPAMLQAGVCVGLGNDGFSNDAFAEMKVADMLQKVHRRDPRALGAEAVVRMAYAHNARIAQLFWPNATGTLEISAPGDVILLDYKPFTELHADNVPWHMLFGMSGGMVTHTIVGGRVLMADRELVTLDEAEIAAKAREAADRAWARVRELA